jgi:hypothetical protein
MKEIEFNEILERRIELIKATLSKKSSEYANGGDRLHNFRMAAKMNNCSNEQALWGMLTKHLVSVMDMVKQHPGTITKTMIDEKIGDCINYFILLEACMIESDNNNPPF